MRESVSGVFKLILSFNKFQDAYVERWKCQMRLKEKKKEKKETKRG